MAATREKRTIDKHSYYDWPRTWELVRSLQPDAVIFSDVGPDIRWVGNEKGFANETCWATYDPVGEKGGPASPGDTKAREGMTGHRHGSHWLPAECDVSIRPGWFWHEKENGRVKTGAELFDLYLRSVGRGASFLLNVPPDRRGLLHEKDVASLDEFRRLVDDAFRQPAGHGSGLSLKLSGPCRFIRLREDIRKGQRIEAFVIEALSQGAWSKTAEGTSVGSCRIIRLDAPLKAERLRLRIPQSSAPPVVSEFTAY